MIDWKETLIAQYANAPTLVRLLEDFNDNMDPRAFFKAFYDQVWNIATAGAYGLDVWGQIVGLDRTIVSLVGQWFGFQQETSLMALPFNQGVFWDGQSAVYGSITQDNDLFRKAILVKAYANLSDLSIFSINRLLSLLFAGRGTIYVRDNQNMTMSIITDWHVTEEDRALLMVFESAIKPTGVYLDFN